MVTRKKEKKCNLINLLRTSTVADTLSLVQVNKVSFIHCIHNQYFHYHSINISLSHFMSCVTKCIPSPFHLLQNLPRKYTGHTPLNNLYWLFIFKR